VLDELRQTATRYSNLEYDLEAGARGNRDSHTSELLIRLTGAEDAIVVNNCAAAILVVLTALSGSGEVIVSRGELIEIGDGFRIPEVMAQSGAILREVGTTNRTRMEDYERAITDKTRLLLRVHPSNFQMSGFTDKPSLADLVALSRRANIPLVEDLGSGCLVDLSSYGIFEPTVRQSIEAERLPLARQVTELEQKLADRRVEFAKAQRFQENQLVELNALKNEARQRSEEVKYVDSLLTEYARAFRSRLNFVEEPRYQPLFGSTVFTPLFGVEVNPVTVRGSAEIERAVTEFARGPAGYVAAGGEPYIALAPARRLPDARCSFKRDDVFALDADSTPGVVRIAPTTARAVGLLNEMSSWKRAKTRSTARSFHAAAHSAANACACSRVMSSPQVSNSRSRRRM
jgi:hypothetical protein